MSTLKEMAATLNLSVMAVSKALRDAPDISISTKARVQAEARRRNYIPNRAAQNLRLRRTGLIGIVVPQINHTYYSNLVWGVERQAEAMGLHGCTSPAPPPSDRADNEMREVQKLIGRQVEALLLVPAVRWQHRLATLELVRTNPDSDRVAGRLSGRRGKFSACELGGLQRPARRATRHRIFARIGTSRNSFPGRAEWVVFERGTIRRLPARAGGGGRGL